jgi:hypothetical protein
LAVDLLAETFLTGPAFAVASLAAVLLAAGLFGAVFLAVVFLAVASVARGWGAAGVAWARFVRRGVPGAGCDDGASDMVSMVSADR